MRGAIEALRRVSEGRADEIKRLQGIRREMLDEADGLRRRLSESRRDHRQDVVRAHSALRALWAECVWHAGESGQAPSSEVKAQCERALGEELSEEEPGWDGVQG